MPAGHVSRSLDGSLCEPEERELQAGPAADAGWHTDFPCEGVSRHVLLFCRAFSRVLVRCAGVAMRLVVPESVGLTSSVLPRATPNQAMQLTASKLAIYAGGVCRRASMLRGMRRGLAAADLVSR